MRLQDIEIGKYYRVQTNVIGIQICRVIRIVGEYVLVRFLEEEQIEIPVLNYTTYKPNRILKKLTKSELFMEMLE